MVTSLSVGAGSLLALSKVILFTVELFESLISNWANVVLVLKLKINLY